MHVKSIQLDQSPFPRRYDPGNPDADKEGYVSYPNVDLSIEFVNALEASRAYEANVTMMDTAKSMFNSSLRFWREGWVKHMIESAANNLGKISRRSPRRRDRPNPRARRAASSFADVLKKSIERSVQAPAGRHPGRERRRHRPEQKTSPA